MESSNCVAIVNELNLEIPTQDQPNKILLNTDPVYFYDSSTNSGWYYVFMSFGRYTHCILKSYDLINYEFVTDIPLGFISEEAQLAIINNRIYACCRSS